MSVDLVSESGRTRVTTKATSPLFATLLSMYDLHDVPDRIALRGSLGEIFDEEYSSLTRGDFVPLSSVSRIIKVLDVGRDELLRIYADLGRDRESRFHHYEEVGRVLNDDYPILSNISNYCSFILAELTNYEGEEVVKLNGALRSAHIVGKCNDEKSFSPESILWEDLIPFTQEDSPLCNSVKLLSGLLEDPEAELHLPWRLLHQLPSRGESGRKAIHFVYNRLLCTIPEEVTPHDFGIDALITYYIPRGDPLTPRSDSATVIKQINTSLTHHIDLTNYESSLDELVQTIEREGLSRFSVCLYHYNKKDGTVYSRACANLIDSYLRGNKAYPSPYPFLLCICLLSFALALFLWRCTYY